MVVVVKKVVEVLVMELQVTALLPQDMVPLLLVTEPPWLPLVTMLPQLAMKLPVGEVMEENMEAVMEEVPQVTEVGLLCLYPRDTVRAERGDQRS